MDCSELGEEVQCIQGVCVVAGESEDQQWGRMAETNLRDGTVPAPVPSTTPRKRFGKRNHRY